MSGRAAVVAAAVTGALCYLAFPGRDLWPCALLAYLPLIVALEGRTPRTAAGLGVVAGLVMNACGLSWLYATIRRFSEWSAPTCALLMLVACCWQAGRTGLLGWIFARARARGWPATPVFLGAFVATELAYPLMFPWTFGACAHRVPALMQWAEVGGAPLVGLILLAPGLALARAFVEWRRGDRARPRMIATGAAVPVAAALIGLVQIWYVDQRVNAAPPVHVGLAQPNLDPPSLRDRFDRVERAARITNELRQRGVDFVVWSEGVVLGVPADGAAAYLPTLFTRRLGVPALIGALTTRGEGKDRRLLNSALATAADGTVVGHYEKHRLFPVGEWLPLFDTFPGLYRRLRNPLNFAPGAALDPLPIAGHPATVLICYEDLFPDFVNDAVGAGKTEMLINLTNDAWFGDTAEPWMHLALAKFRAIEHRRYLVRATNSGVSAIVDPVGRVVVHGGTFREEAIDGAARWFSGPRTAYEVLGDGPAWLATLATAVMALRRRHRPGPIAPA